MALRIIRRRNNWRSPVPFRIALPLLIWVGFNVLTLLCTSVLAQGGDHRTGLEPTYDGLITLGSILSLLGSIAGAGTVIVRVTNAVGKLKEDLKADISETGTSLKDQLIQLERDFGEKIHANREEVVALNSKLDASLLKYMLLEKDYAGLLLRVQNLENHSNER